MVNSEGIFNSKVSYRGIFSFKDFYTFCYNWLRDETQISDFSEDKYSEKLSGDAKNIDIEWTGTRNLTDFFRFQIKVAFKIIALTSVKVKKDGAEIETNKGDVEVRVKGNLMSDYQNKFEMTAFKKTLRGLYEKYVIPSAVREFKAKIISDCDEFLNQSKAFLDLEGKK